MQLAQQLAAKAAEARRREAERIQPMLQAGRELAFLWSLCADLLYGLLHPAVNSQTK